VYKLVTQLQYCTVAGTEFDERMNASSGVFEDESAYVLE
jgi:hypothetical protein